MAVVLVRMRLALLRHTFRDGSRGLLVTGAGLGLLLAAGTLGVGIAGARHTGDLLALLYAVWSLGWLFGPVFAGSGDGELHAEYFTPVPLSSRQLSTSLLIASLVGVGPVVTALALGGLVGFGAQSNVSAAAAAVLVALLQGLLMVLASRLVIELIGELMRTRFGTLMVALPWALVIATVCDLGVLLYAIGEADPLNSGLSDRLAAFVRVLPSGWSVRAVEAAGAGNLGDLVWAVSALALLAAVCFAGWTTLLKRDSTRQTERSVRPGSMGWSRILPQSPLGAVIGRELRSWSRDPMRSYFWWFAVLLGLILSLIPLIVGYRAYLPWAGTVITIMAAAGAANLYAVDGSALWLTLSTSTTRIDVRGRQLAWLLRVGPISVVITVVGVALSGQLWSWPWALSLQLAALGTGAGTLILFSTFAPIRMPDAHRRGRNPAVEGGNITGLAWATIGVVVIGMVPVLSVMLVGTWLGWPELVWAGLPIGALVGLLAALLLARSAQRRLALVGPELLERLRTGADPIHRRPVEQANPAALQVTAKRASPSAVATRIDRPSRRPRHALIAGLCFGSSWIPLLSAYLSWCRLDQPSATTLWTFALSFPDPFRTMAIAMLIAAGGVFLGVGVRMVLPSRATSPDVTGSAPDHELTETKP